MASTVRGLGLELYEVPKPAGGVRILSALDPTTSRRYADLVSAAAPVGPWTRRRLAFGVGVTAEDLASERTRWRRAVAHATRAGVAIGSDVRACFPSIGADAVGIALSKAGARAPDVARLLALLHDVASVGGPGLPVGPSPSAVVADAVLRLGDSAVRGAGGSVVRWVDDVVIVGVDRITAVRAFDAWAGCLRELGLEPHDGKTSLLDVPVPPSAPSALPAPSRGMMRRP